VGGGCVWVWVWVLMFGWVGMDVSVWV